MLNEDQLNTITKAFLMLEEEAEAVLSITNIEESNCLGNYAMDIHFEEFGGNTYEIDMVFNVYSDILVYA